MFDLVIAGGAVITPKGVARQSIGIRDGRIETMFERRDPCDAAQRIDAEGMIILPGLVDAHVHFREPGLVHKEGFFTGSRAAAAGGVTTVMVMPTDDPITTTPDLFMQKIELGAKASHVDFALQAALGPDASHVRELVDLGAVSFELFLADQPQILIRTMNELLHCLETVGSEGAVAGMTAGDDSITLALTQKFERAPSNRLNFARSRPQVAEASGVARACLAAIETGTKTHIRQVSCALAAGLVRHFVAANLTAEVTPHNLLLDEGELLRQGPIAKVSPPLRPAADVLAMQRALRDGTIGIVATDHAPHLPEEKRAGELDIWQAPRGLPGVQTFLPLMLRLVGDGLIDYPDLARCCCEAPARLFGLYPKKGALVPGADADLVIVDPNKPFMIRNEDQLSKSRLTPFHGWEVPATPVLALQRGRTIMANGVPTGSPAGQFVRPVR